jgi:hypothetical protein
VKPSRLLPWVGWNSGQISVLLLPPDEYSRGRTYRTVTTTDPFFEVTRIWWERFAALGEWNSAARIARVTTERRPNLWRGWEDLAWALFKQGKTRQAYKLLAPKLRKLELPGPPSGRAAYSLACFCGSLGRVKEGTRWLRLAYNLCHQQDNFRLQALTDPDLREIWPAVSELSLDACSVLE